jgi:hypothetical protein
VCERAGGGDDHDRDEPVEEAERRYGLAGTEYGLEDAERGERPCPFERGRPEASPPGDNRKQQHHEHDRGAHRDVDRVTVLDRFLGDWSVARFVDRVERAEGGERDRSAGSDE